MTIPTLTLIDIRRVQGYLFNANELKQNLGASALVEQATHEWVFGALPQKRNAQWDAKGYRVVFDEKAIEKDGLDAEVIFMGGGNAAILFSTFDMAKSFTKEYTESLLVNAPGLEVAVAHVKDVDMGKSGAMREAWKTMQEVEMPKQKEGRLVSQPLLGLSVTAECAYTGLPAVAEVLKNPNTPLNQETRGVLVSSQSFVKQTEETVKSAKQRLNDLLDINYFQYPSDFEELGGERGKSSFIAVVHADGNSMGKRIQAYTEDEDNREMIHHMREFSEKVNRIGLEAMQAVRDYLLDQFTYKEEPYKVIDRFDPNEAIRLMKNPQKKYLLPLRPLVFGGDDITFVCDGRLGLAFAAKLLQAFYNAELPDKKKTYACAGVAIVHSHYPFARAYALAEELCQSAKHQARSWDPEDNAKGTGSRVSLINWHIASSGRTLDWDETQKREFANQHGQLLLRPLVVDKATDIATPAWQTWQTFTEQVAGFRLPTSFWSTQRNKQKDLREVLRKGADSTRKFTKQNGELPGFAAAPTNNVVDTGWIEKQCLYFDALEALDFFVYPEEK
jgi:hypothetical protein